MQTDDGLHVRYRGATGCLLSMMDRQDPIDLKVADDADLAFSLKDAGNPGRCGRIRAGCKGEESARLTLEGESQPLAARLRAEIYPQFSCIRHDIVFEDLSGEDRALTLRYQLPIRAEGWSWWDDASTPRVIEAGRRYVRYDDETRGQFPLCWYPLGTISDPKGGHAITFAVPLNPPTLARVGYDGNFFIEFDFAVSAATAKFPSRAEFSFFLYTSAPGWGFRGALRKYYDVFPADFVKRVNREGFWLARTPIQYLRAPEDFGVVFHQVASVKTNPLHYDNAAGIYAFQYDEPSRVSLSIAAEKRPEPEDFVQLLKTAAADPQSPIHEDAIRVQRMASLRADGGYYVYIFPRGVGQFTAYFEANLDPEIVVDDVENASRLDEWWGGAEGGMLGGREGRNDGVYIDSCEAWVYSINFNKDHFRFADRPLNWDPQSGKPGIVSALSTYKYLREGGRRLHDIGKLFMANFTPFNHAFFATVFDVLGTEVWMSKEELASLFRQRAAEPGGKERLLAAGFTDEEIAKCEKAEPATVAEFHIEAVDPPMNFWTHEGLMHYRRALCWQKPYNLLLKLMNKRGMAVFGLDRLVEYIEWCMFWGIYPAVSEGMVVTQDEIGPIYRRYMPVIQAMGQAGWEPVTHARTSQSDVRVERFGYCPQNTLHFAVRNFGAASRQIVLSIDAGALKIPEGVEIRDAVGGERLRAALSDETITVKVALAPGQTRVLRVANPLARPEKAPSRPPQRRAAKKRARK